MSFLNTMDEIITVDPECDQEQAIEMQPNVQEQSYPRDILIRGEGINMYGMLEKFESTFPPRLVNIVSEEQFFATIDRVNQLLKKTRKTIKKWWIFGIVFVCCTWGYSIWPAVFKHREAFEELRQMLKNENEQIYHELGIHWKMTRIMSTEDNYLPEYALGIEFMNKE